jgi:Tol biopolymer transport system component
MTPERFREIEALYQSARERGADVLATADPELRKVVESLLAQEPSDKSAGHSAAETMTQSIQTAIAVGSQLGPYKIEAVLGAGGMGQVFRAVDTRLARGVAIKISHETFTERFEREARMIAALNHPHICTLYDIGPNYLVMELVEGETIAARLKRGKLSIDETLRYGAQIADALAAAHARGITHRDLKPGNIMLTKAGVKVLDFGLAKSSRDDSLTATNVALGTPAYMAPEQFEAKDCDARTDIYALGLVLFEMASGKRLVQGESPSIKGTPQFSHIVERCLAKDPDERWQSASDVRKELEWARQMNLSPAAAQTAPSGAFRGIAGWIAAGILLLASVWLYFRTSAAPHVMRASIALPGNSINLHSFALSPDGRYVAISAQVNGKLQLWLRSLNAFQAQAMPSTDDGMYPFWSPDSRAIGFFAQGKLKTIAIDGGPAQALCEAPFGRGGTWNRDDVIVFSPTGAVEGLLQKVSAAGGAPTNLSTAKGVYEHPLFLPDGRHYLYSLGTPSAETTGIYLGSLGNPESKRILPDRSGMAFSAGQLLFVRDNTLMAQPLDTSSWQPKGGAIPFAADVSKTSNVDYAPVSASESGLLLYQTGGRLARNQIVWIDRQGKPGETVSAPGGVHNPTLSPDEKLLAFTRQAEGSVDVWIRDLAHETERRFTSTPNAVNGKPVWSPTGDRIVFQSSRTGTRDLYQKPASGGQEEVLLANHDSKIPTHWSHDGRFLLYTQTDPKTKRDIWVIPMEGAKVGEAFPFLHSESNEYLGQLSPNTHWMAYTSDESGQPEVYVRPFPTGQGQLSISLAGGEQPHWRADGKELFFLAADGKMMAVATKTGASLEPGKPQPLFDANLVRPPNEPLLDYDVTADGNRFLLSTTASSSASAVLLNLVTNWDTELKK